VILALVQTHRAASAPAAVGAYIAAAYFFTSSTSFANPAITIGRMFSATFAGIAPSSAPGYIGAQIAGGAVALAIIRLLYPSITPDQAADVVVPHPASDSNHRRPPESNPAHPASGAGEQASLPAVTD
jgi:hypothetical protein